MFDEISEKRLRDVVLGQMSRKTTLEEEINLFLEKWD